MPRVPHQPQPLGAAPILQDSTIPVRWSVRASTPTSCCSGEINGLVRWKQDGTPSIRSISVEFRKSQYLRPTEREALWLSDQLVEAVTAALLTEMGLYLERELWRAR